ncbi:MAG TPA: hypothetical protein EYH34_13700, partial [Planctomycetes bacterium]|nr:hypothetical protein [Planctomycetota bacterium]
MRIALVRLCAIIAVTLYTTLAGCGSAGPSPEQTDSASPPAREAAGHDDHQGHAHAGDPDHAHPTEGPHGGRLIELGAEEYHAELLHDEETHRVTIHLLDAAGKEPVAVPSAEITLQLLRNGQFASYTLAASPDQGDPEGAASRFETVDTALCDALCHDEELRGRLQVTISGKAYTGTIEHKGHEGHEAHEGAEHTGH